MAVLDPIPAQSRLVDKEGVVSTVWYRFLNSIFGKILKRLDALETTTADHETRIEALEP